MPRRSLPSDEIICGFHGGSYTRSTFACEIAGIVSSFCLALQIMFGIRATNCPL